MKLEVAQQYNTTVYLEQMTDHCEDCGRLMPEGVAATRCFECKEFYPAAPFSTAENIRALLGQLAGAASMCWEAGVFDSSLASDFVNDAYIRIANGEYQDHDGNWHKFNPEKWRPAE